MAGVPVELTARLRQFFPAQPTPAAVLIPIVDRNDTLSVLLTERATHLRHHAGQISFPGGRVEARDRDVLEAALRETEEEIGLARDYVSIAGRLPDQLVISGYTVTPVVGFVADGFTLHLDPTEVEGTFEVPLEYVLDPANRRPRLRTIKDITFTMYDIPWEHRNIWGATASMLISLCQLLEDA